MSSSLDRARAEFAIERALGDASHCGFGDVNSEAKEVTLFNGYRTTLKEYRSVVMSAVPFLRQCGLLQVAGFYASKKGAHHAVLADVAAWLKASPLSKGLCGDLRHGNPTQTFQDLTRKSAAELSILEVEAEAILTWLKRLVEAKAKELEPRSKPTREAEPGKAKTSVPVPGGQPPASDAGAME